MKLPTLLILICLSCPAVAQPEDDTNSTSEPLKGNVSKTDLGGAAGQENNRNQRLKQRHKGAADKDSEFGGAASDEQLQKQQPGQAHKGSADADALSGSAVQEEQNVKPMTQSANHGEIAVGVIGYTFDNDTGKILTIYPGSDLPKHGVKIGDYVVSVDGHPYDPNNPRAEPDFSIGAPGTIVHMVFKHNGRLFNADVERRDSRFFVGNPSSDGYFEWAASQTRRW